MKVVRWLAFIVIFFADVHVRAQDLAPCWGKSLPCAIQSKEFRKPLRAEGMSIVLGSESLLEQRDSSSLHLIRGRFLAEVSRPIFFRTPYASLRCEHECVAIFEREVGVLTIKSLKGIWRVRRLGETRDYSLSPGLQLMVREVNDLGVAQMEFPQSLPWSSTTKEWASLYFGELSKFKSELAEFREVWSGAVDAVSDLHHSVVQREIASYENTQAKERAAQRAHEAEDESLRSMFRAKNYLNP